MRRTPDWSRFFPVLRRRYGGKRVVYLDSACSALKPEAVIRACAEYERTCGGCGGRRSVHWIARKSEELMEGARETVRRFLGAQSSREVVFTSGATEGLNRVLRSFPYSRARNAVLATTLEHNSAFLPLYEMQREGKIRLRLFAAERDGSLNLQALEKAVTRQTALVVVSHSSNVYGSTQPIREIARFVHAAGARILVDDAQYVSSNREDVVANEPDFVVFSGHKLGGPGGTGVLWGRLELLESLRPLVVGGGTVRNVSFGSGGPVVEYLDVPHRLEAGTPNHAGIVGLGEAIRFLDALGADCIRRHIADLVDYAWRRLEKFPVRLLGRRELATRGSILALHFADPRASETDFNLFLNHELPGRTFAVRVGRHCADLLHHRMGLQGTLRLSFFVYNKREDVDWFVEALALYLKGL